jgi:hypothetical protein
LIRYAFPHLSLSSTVQMAAAAANPNDLVAKSKADKEKLCEEMNLHVPGANARFA